MTQKIWTHCKMNASGTSIWSRSNRLASLVMNCGQVVRQTWSALGFLHTDQAGGTAVLCGAAKVKCFSSEFARKIRSTFQQRMCCPNGRSPHLWIYSFPDCRERQCGRPWAQGKRDWQGELILFRNCKLILVLMYKKEFVVRRIWWFTLKDPAACVCVCVSLHTDRVSCLKWASNSNLQITGDSHLKYVSNSSPEET